MAELSSMDRHCKASVLSRCVTSSEEGVSLVPADGPGWCIRLVEQTVTVEEVCCTRCWKSRRTFLLGPGKRTFARMHLPQRSYSALTFEAGRAPARQPRHPLALLTSIPQEEQSYSRGGGKFASFDVRKWDY